MLNLISRPNLVSPVYNKIEFKFSFSGYSIGDLFYLEIYKADNSLLTTLTKNGNGLGQATFDVSYALQTLFTEVKILDPTLFVQVDETGLKGYKVKAGIQKMVNNVPVKTKYYQTDLMYAVRAAFPTDGSQNINDYLLNSTQPGKFLTLNPGMQPNNSNIFLPVVVTTPLDVLARAEDDTDSFTTFLSLATGLVVFNAIPGLVGLPSSKEFYFWLELETTDQLFYATKDYTANCSTGMLGRSIATASSHSTISQALADSQATSAAQALAGANLVCVTDPMYQPEPGDGSGGQDS